jgi:hypothetical protein
MGSVVRVFLRVHKVESIRDIDGNLGKRIELVEDRDGKISRAITPRSEEAQMVQDVMQALQQQMPMFSMRASVVVPKIILFLTEQEYEALDIKFDVNQTYQISLENQTLKFTRETVP